MVTDVNSTQLWSKRKALGALKKQIRKLKRKKQIKIKRR